MDRPSRRIVQASTETTANTALCAPVVLRQSVSNDLLRRSGNRVQDLPVALEWPSKYDEALVDQRVHEAPVLPPTPPAHVDRATNPTNRRAANERKAGAPA